jgi:hypothetical protein
MPNGAAGDEDEESTPPITSIRHAGNKALLAVVGNFRLEAREHTRGLDRIYTTLRDLDGPAPAVTAPQLLDEMERHHAATGENIAALAALVTR